MTIIHGAIRGYAMQIIYWINKTMRLILLILAILITNPVMAERAYTPVIERNKLYVLDNSNPKIRLAVPLVINKTDWLVEESLKDINGITYLAVFHREPSISDQPEGFCGSGTELWLHIYKVQKNKVNFFGRILASSCKKSFSMASLESGFLNSDKDYSSFQWTHSGFSIDWFSKKDESGKDILKTVYSITSKGIYPE